MASAYAPLHARCRAVASGHTTTTSTAISVPIRFSLHGNHHRSMIVMKYANEKMHEGDEESAAVSPLLPFTDEYVSLSRDLDDGFQSLLLDMDNDVRDRIGKPRLAFEIEEKEGEEYEEKIGIWTEKENLNNDNTLTLNDGGESLPDCNFPLNLDFRPAPIIEPIEVSGDHPNILNSLDHQEKEDILDIDVKKYEEVVNTPFGTTKDDTISLNPTSTLAPGVRSIIAFAIPAIAIWLCGPLLSLIDTAAVGIFAGTRHQAALAPAVAVTDYTGLLIAFMFTGTTNLMAESGVTADDNSDVTSPGKKSALTFASALKVSTVVGIALGSALLVFSKLMVRSIIGNDALDPAVMTTALRYVRIRALGFPAAAVMGSAQAGCIGLRDVRAPLRALVAAAVINLFGDILLVPLRRDMWGGAAGAAWATVFSQYAASAFFIRLFFLRKKIHDNDDISIVKSGIKRKMSLAHLIPSGFTRLRAVVPTRLGSKLSKISNSRLSRKGKKLPLFSTKGFFRKWLQPRDLLCLPSLSEVKLFQPYVVPVTTTSVGRVSSYIAKSHVVSACMGETAMAAHQILLSIFYCLCPVADSLNLTAQSFVPTIFQRRKSVERTTALNKTFVDFVKAGALFGTALMIFTAGIPFFSFLLTKDMAVRAEVNKIVPLFTGIFGLHGMITASEGVLLGHKDLSFLAKSYGFFFFAVPYFMLRLKSNFLQNTAIKLSSVWSVFFSYQLVRLSLFFIRLAVLSRSNRLNRMEDDDIIPLNSSAEDCHEPPAEELTVITPTDLPIENLLDNRDISVIEDKVRMEDFLTVTNVLPGTVEMTDIEVESSGIVFSDSSQVNLDSFQETGRILVDETEAVIG